MSCPAYDENGLELIKWIEKISGGTCMYGTLSAISWSCGKISLVSWLGAQLPQVVVNYLHHSVEGLSLGFLISWFIGDGTNFLGSLLTHQMTFQILLGLYFCFIDTILGFQYFYYTKINHTHDDNSPSQATQKLHRLGGTKKFLTSVATTASLISRSSAAPITTTASGAGVSLVAIVGAASSWICTFMYLTSRIPQIMENYRRKSTWGTSILLFFSALTGNITYSISILTSAEARGPNASQFLWNEFPFLIGSAGTVLFDLMIFFQYFYYGNDPTTVLEDGTVYHHLLDDGSGHHHHNSIEHPHHQYPDFSLFHSSAVPIRQKSENGCWAVDDDGNPYKIVGTPTPSDTAPLTLYHKPVYGE